MSKKKVSTGSPSSAVPHLSIPTLRVNLRLLDLDKLEDWPDLSTKAFTGNDEPQNQKFRIQCVEWICYHLFQTWNPEECRNVSEVHSLQIMACAESISRNCSHSSHHWSRSSLSVFVLHFSDV